MSNQNEEHTEPGPSVDDARLMIAKNRYNIALHAVQSGIAACVKQRLEIGIDAATINDRAVTTLLIKKGVFSEVEYFEQMADSAEAYSTAEAEQARYDAYVGVNKAYSSDKTGTNAETGTREKADEI